MNIQPFFTLLGSEKPWYAFMLFCVRSVSGTSSCCTQLTSCITRLASSRMLGGIVDIRLSGVSVDISYCYLSTRACSSSAPFSLENGLWLDRVPYRCHVLRASYATRLVGPGLVVFLV